MKKAKKHPWLKNLIFIILGIGLVITGIFIVWASTLQLPDFKSLGERKIQSSTKIYDRTGKILLYDIHQNVRRTVIPYQDMGTNILNATVAIEDSDFYKHYGIRISSIIRATIWAELTGRRIQGGSTITQQLIKNTLLTPRRTLTRKIKEWILSMKVERIMSKEKILTLYLNEVPYGGNIYGIDEASKSFFGKAPTELTLAEASYLAAIPNAPTYYSPYGKHLKELEDRKNLVLQRMLDLKFITKEKYNEAINKKVVFLPEQPTQIAAPHFVFFIKKYLEKEYGVTAVEEGGLKVITTLDYNLQKKAEAIVLADSKINEKKYNGSNAAVVVIDPKTGQILAMVGSRDYFDKKIDGNFNVAIALRQPGSSFKPIVYAEAFKKGYTDKTTLFDVPTEFNSSCDGLGKPLPGSADAKCYMPTDFNTKYRGPMTLRNGLAQSINIIAIKLLYLVGIPNTIKMAHNLGITSLNDPNRYGLSLAIGGGETSLLDMTSVYGVFANDGIRNPYQAILSVRNSSGKILEQYENKGYRVLAPNITRIISSILSDNKARTPTFGAYSILVIPGSDVAVKTGTTNDDRDAWTIGYTPSVAVGVWVGNDNNTPMKRGGSAMAGPIWNSVIKDAIKEYPGVPFKKPTPINKKLPPIVRGFWQGGKTFLTDKISGGLATVYTPQNLIKETSITNVHTILYWLNRANPFGPEPASKKDLLFNNWEYGVNNWWQINKQKYKIVTEADVPTFYDNVHTEVSKPIFEIDGINNTTYRKNNFIPFSIKVKSKNLIKKIDIFINNTYLTSLRTPPFKTSFKPSSINNITKNNVLHVVGYDVLGNQGEATLNFSVLN